jgi:hypothetical protein
MLSKLSSLGMGRCVCVGGGVPAQQGPHTADLHTRHGGGGGMLCRGGGRGEACLCHKEGFLPSLTLDMVRCLET